MYKLVCTFTVLAALASLAAQPLPTYKQLKFPPLRQVKVPKPDIFVLSNGIKVYLLEEHELPVVSGFALIRTGNLFDPPAKRGLAELTGSVLRSGGTKSQTGDQIDTSLEGIAAAVESNIGEERGNLSFNCLKENTDQVLGIFKDLLTEPEFRQDKLDLAKTQVRSGISRRNDEPGGIANREFQSILYGRDTPYGWNIEYEHIDAIKRDDLVAFYKRYYFPSNIMLAVYGDFNASEMKAKLERLLSSWTVKQPPVPAFPVLSSKPEPGIFLAEKPDVTQTFFEMGHIGGLLSDKDYPALEVATDILGSGFSSRLMRKVRTELGYAYSINAGWGAGYLHNGLFNVSGSTKSESTAETIRVIGQELAKMRSGEVTDLELKTAKDTVLNGFVFFFDTPAKTLNRLVTYDYFHYPNDFIFQYQKAVDSVTKADILRVAKKYLKPEDLTIVAVGNSTQFGEALTTLKLPVKPIDLTIPEPSLKPSAAASPEALLRGKRMLARAQAAVGGAAKLAAIKDLTRVAEATISAGGQGQMKAKQVTRIIEPSAFRQDQELPFGKISVYSDGKTGWLATPQGTQALPPPVLKQVQDEMAHSLDRMLLASDVTLTGDGKLQIGNAQLAIDETTGLPLKLIYQMEGQAIEESFSDWRDVDGVKMPFKISTEQGGKHFGDTTVSSITVNTGLKAEDLSKKQ